MRDDFIQKHAASQYNSLLNIARFVASALRTKSLSDITITAAASLMKLEFWLEDVALDCKAALEEKDMTLSPLVRGSCGSYYHADILSFDPRHTTFWLNCPPVHQSMHHL
jgi:hypothetical protein